MIDKIVSRPASFWTYQEGPYRHIVISSRIRLARNLKGYPMPYYQTAASGQSVLEKVEKAAAKLKIPGGRKLHPYRISELSSLERQILQEKHLISPEHTEAGPNKGLLISGDEAISIMVNEEDHLRIQVLFPGLQLDQAWELADILDNLLEEKLEFAFHEDLGYLTACPTNVGTGLRASVMVHLPALVMTKQASKIFSASNQLGLAVRGLYGEGTEAVGNLFQISNQITLGHTETEIIQNLQAVTGQIIGKEEETRQLLLKEARDQIADKVGRAYGVLKNAAILSSQEALSLLSDIRLGIDMGLLDTGCESSSFNELMVAAQPGYLQQVNGKAMEPLERDIVRARLFKEKFAKIGGK